MQCDVLASAVELESLLPVAARISKLIQIIAKLERRL